MEDLDTEITTEEVVVRAKWSMEGAKTLGEAAQMLRQRALDLEGLENDGWQLKGPVEDDYGFITLD